MRAPIPTPDRPLEAVTGVVRATWRELHASAGEMPETRAETVLDRDLGFDSLGRMELLLRIEHALGVHLPEDTLQRAETVADLCDAVLCAGAAPAPRASDARAVVPLPAADTGPAEGSPLEADTLLAAFQWHLSAHPDRIQVTCLADEAEVPLSHRALDASARALGAGLLRAGVQPRQCVALMLPTSAEYFGAFMAILYAGAIPVPIYPPARASQLEDHVLRHAGILDNAQAVMLVTVPEAIAVARLLQARVPTLLHVVTPARLSSPAEGFAPHPVRADEIAFLQYTSGSTGNPKGVALTHANLMANIRAMAATVQATPRDVFVSWLPLYHDMGLIGAWLGGLVVGYSVVVMSPLAFLARPARWLQAIHRHRGTLSAAPNFAYELCLKRIDDAELAGVDLSTWRLAFNGAEAVSPDTVLHFHERFAAQGLRRETMAPVYGLAECCVGLLFPPLGRAPLIDRVQREPLTREGRAVPARDDDATALRFVACGAPLPGHDVRLLDVEGNEVGERIEGRLEFRGPSATLGYYRNPTQTAQLVHAGGWLDSGDRAYRAGQDYYLTGRVKDIVIRGGRNLHPQEIEEAVGAVDGVRRGCVAVFGSADAASGTERLVVLAELRPGAAPAPVREAAAQAVIAAIGEPADEIVLAPPHTVLKTSSGKLRRSACRAWYESGQIGRAPSTARMQALRLGLGALRPRLRSVGRSLMALAFGLNTYLWFCLLTPLTWLLTMLLPRPAWAWALGHRMARLLLRLAGVPFEVQGLDRLPAGPCVLVCNHGSYADGMLLVAALARPFVFVAKRELRSQPVAGGYLRRLGAEFVERVEVGRSVADAERLAAVVERGRSLLVFPEGTFVDRPGLLPFHLGAFLAAARAGVPVVPVALSGSRRLLPGGSGWPRRSRVLVCLGEPILPDPTAPNVFAAGVRLRDAARSAIARSLAATQGALPDTDAVRRFLGTPAAHAGHAGAVSAVETIETHMSWLFVAGEQVLKLKKPVRYPFLDFSTPAAREASCREEVRLNSRLAPGVYRGLMVLQWRDGRLFLAPEAEADPHAATLDCLVWMRRLPRERMLDRQIAQASVTAADIDALVGVLTAFYRGATAIDIDPDDYVGRIVREQATNRALLLQPGLQPDGVAQTLDRFDAALERHAAALRARAAQRRIVDGHGDLRPEHVCMLHPPLVIDCLEFNAALRQVDPFDELAFLGLECELAGAAWIGSRLVDGCAAALGERPEPPLLALYTAYRALLRARLALAHLLEPQPRTPERWLPLARRYIARARVALDACEVGFRAPTTRGTA